MSGKEEKEVRSAQRKDRGTLVQRPAASSLCSHAKP